MLTVTTDEAGGGGGGAETVSVLVAAVISVPAPAVIVEMTVEPCSVSAVEEASTGTSVDVVPVSVGSKELNDANTDEETAGASVTGHTVVVIPTTVVTRTVDTPSGSDVGSKVTASVPETAGQLVTVDAQEMIVLIEVAYIVSVVKPASAAVVVFANGGTIEVAAMLLVTVTLFTR